MKRLFLFMAICVAVPAYAATTRYADDNGTVSTGNCDVTQTGSGACTITRAVAVLVGGDTLQLADGTYDYRCNDCIPSGSAGAPTIVRAANALQASLTPVSSTSDLSAVLLVSRSYITFDGVDINAASLAPSGAAGAFTCSGACDHIIFQNGQSRNGHGDFSSVVFGHFDNSTFQTSTFKDTTNGTNCCLEHNFYVYGANLTIQDNDISGATSGYGIQIRSGTVNTTSLVIRRNRIHGNGKTSAASGGIILSSVDSGDIYNNLIYSNLDQGIDAYNITGSVNIIFNTFYSNTAKAIKAESGMVTVASNIFWANGSVIDNTGASMTCTSNLNESSCGPTQGGTDPNFTNASLGNFHILTDLNGGLASGTVTSDYDLVTRANPPDRGAFEYVAATTPTTAPVGKGKLRGRNRRR